MHKHEGRWRRHFGIRYDVTNNTRVGVGRMSRHASDGRADECTGGADIDGHQAGGRTDARRVDG